MTSPASTKLERDRLLQKSLSRWENEGGHDTAQQKKAGAGAAPPAEGLGGVPPLTNSELVQLQIRMIALENLVVALLAEASEQQLELVRQLAQSIVPRPGVDHRLTVNATAQMEHLTQRSRRLQLRMASAQGATDPK